MKYTLDTNIYIDAFRDVAAEAALVRFLERALPFTFLSAVVMQELAAGARTAAQRRELERSVFGPVVRRGRVFTPSAIAFVESGRLIADVAHGKGGTPFVRIHRCSMMRCLRRLAASRALFS